MNNRKYGFSLVEALVALVILATTFSAIWGWFGAAAQSSQRVEEALNLPGVYQHFTAKLSLEPLTSTLQGEYRIREFTVSWSAQRLRSSDRERHRRQPQWIVTLYKIDAVVSAGRREVMQFSTSTLRQREDPNYVPLPR